MIPLILWIIGLVLLLTGELMAALDSYPRNTISEKVWWIIGRGRPITPWFLAARILVFGLLGWLMLHFGTGQV